MVIVRQTMVIVRRATGRRNRRWQMNFMKSESLHDGLQYAEAAMKHERPDATQHEHTLAEKLRRPRQYTQQCGHRTFLCVTGDILFWRSHLTCRMVSNEDMPKVCSCLHFDNTNTQSTRSTSNEQASYRKLITWRAEDSSQR